MKASLRLALAAFALVAVVWSAADLVLNRSLEKQALAAEPSKPMLAHNVFFTLAESSPANREKLVAGCQKWLTDHPGVVFFAVGTPSDLNRPVNDRDFDVGLHVIFEDRAAHDTYQDAERHLKFIEENKHLWNKVRVFDSDVFSKR